MPKIKFRDDPDAMERLSRAASAVEDFCVAHPSDLSENEHKELRGLLSNRASALSEATGMKIHSLFED